MHLKLIIDSKPLDIEVDDVIAGLLATRLNLPAGTHQQEALARHLGEKGTPWLLDDEHMRKRIFPPSHTRRRRSGACHPLSHGRPINPPADEQAGTAARMSNYSE